MAEDLIVRLTTQKNIFCVDRGQEYKNYGSFSAKFGGRNFFSQNPFQVILRIKKVPKKVDIKLKVEGQ